MGWLRIKTAAPSRGPTPALCSASPSLDRPQCLIQSEMTQLQPARGQMGKKPLPNEGGLRKRGDGRMEPGVMKSGAEERGGHQAPRRRGHNA